MSVYYSENDPRAAAWLRALIARDLIAPGDVDERDVRDVKADDLRGYTQHHFFAGIGVWSYALRRAGWGDERPVWTGSCPCQPFSAAGSRTGFADERHLWPAWHWLIGEFGPGVVFGEQVASKDGLAWLDVVQADMEAADYAFGAIDLCAAGFGAPHIRQRTFFVAHAASGGRRKLGHAACPRGGRHTDGGEFVSGLAHANGGGQQRQFSSDDELVQLADATSERRERNGQTRRWRDGPANVGDVRVMADTDDARSQGRGVGRHGGNERPARPSSMGSEGGSASATNGFWRDADWLRCRDGKWRPVEPGTFPLVDGASARVGRLRGYGNAIVAEVAQAFIEEAMTCLP